ncbi:MAG: hypothetical protein BMS9Abin05_2668 [Rhodothermia bacterium]|nr:MAG: hypothetical protein BMS9Abin05_2668 [Rhodothermia bacterium]
MDENKPQASIPDSKPEDKDPTVGEQVAGLQIELRQFETIQTLMLKPEWPTLRNVFKYWMTQRADEMLDAKSWEAFVRARALYGFIQFDLLNMESNVKDHIENLSEQIEDLVSPPAIEPVSGPDDV